MGLIAELGEDPGRLAGALVQQLSLMHLGADDLCAAACCAPGRRHNRHGSDSHQPISSSRQKPESARSTIFTSGQRSRSCATMRLTSSTEPAAASWLAGLSRAHSNWSPAKMYSGR